jgi:hypothetical protein
MTYGELVTMGLELPGVEESTSYGTPALKVRSKLMARLREDDVVVLLAVEDIEKRMLMETQPDTFFITDHYVGYPAVLVRLSRVEATQMRELLETTWRRVAPKRLVLSHEAGGPN